LIYSNNLNDSLTPKVLWDGTLSDGTGTLSETIANFKYIDVFYTLDDGSKGSKRVYNNNSTSTSCHSSEHYRGTDGSELTKSCDISITTGTTLTVSNNRILMWFPVGTLYSNVTGNFVYIKRILGYK
jgi:hypothetical protein